MKILAIMSVFCLVFVSCSDTESVEPVDNSEAVAPEENSADSTEPADEPTKTTKPAEEPAEEPAETNSEPADTEAKLVYKTVPACTVAYILETGDFAKIPAVVGEICAWMGQNKIEATGSLFGVYLDNPMVVKPEECRWEMCMPVAKGTVGTDRVKIKSLPAFEAVTILHKGPYDQVSKAWNQLFKLAQAENIEITGAGREVYVNDPSTCKPEEILTEIQVPYTKK